MLIWMNFKMGSGSFFALVSFQSNFLKPRDRTSAIADSAMMYGEWEYKTSCMLVMKTKKKARTRRALLGKNTGFFYFMRFKPNFLVFS